MSRPTLREVLAVLAVAACMLLVAFAEGSL